MLIDEHQTPGPDLRDVETELCRLPDVAAARIVADHLGRPVEVHILANDGKHPKQVVRDIQSVALASFGLEIDRRIVSVVQLGADTQSSVAAPNPSVANRIRVLAVESRMSGRRSTVRISLGADDREATGFAEGLVTAAARARLVAGATLDALRQLEPAADQLEVEAAEPVRVGENEIVVVTLVAVDPPDEHRLAGSAIVRQHIDDATVRAVLDATNRWLTKLDRGRAA
jgi:hypothetical protein